MWDLCSTDDYITFKKANELKLDGSDVVLTIEGVGGVETTLETKLYNVLVYMKKRKKGQSKFTIVQCYGLEKIADAATPPDQASYRELCNKFKLRMEDMVRPDEIDLLISMRRNTFHPKPVRTMGNMTLYKGPFGQVFGGTEPGLVFQPYVLNGVMQARQQTFRASVKSVTSVSQDYDGKELLHLIGRRKCVQKVILR